jgi:hypothetical protein
MIFTWELSKSVLLMSFFLITSTVLSLMDLETASLFDLNFEDYQTSNLTMPSSI